MRYKLIINDLHIGVRRTGGTTPQSAYGLREWLRNKIRDLITPVEDDCFDIMVNGDALDGFEIDTPELWATVDIFDEWLCREVGDLYLSGGNHDFSAKGGRVSSFELLGRILQLAHPGRVHVYMNGLAKLWHDDAWVIPHCLNQDLFDLELDRALETVPSGSVLFLHCNYDNKFAVQSDHSLNLSQAQAAKLNSAGIKLIIAHEHNKRVLRKGMVYITGNQFPTSVSDCLDDNGIKCAHLLDTMENTISPIETWSNEGGYVEVDWTQLNEVQGELFVRVSGTTTQATSEEALAAIVQFRKTSKAFVVTNAIKVEGLDGLEGFEELSLEDITGFDVTAALLEKLEPEEQVVITRLLENRGA